MHVWWARAAVATGSVLLALSFWFGTALPSATVGGHDHPCGSAIPTSWFMSGAAPAASGAAGATRGGRIEAACDAVEHRFQALTWGSLALGSLVGLSGWTALRERERPRAPHRAATQRSDGAARA